MNNTFELTFDPAAIAAALGVSAQDVLALMTDGRCATFIVQRRLLSDNAGWALEPAGGGSYDLKAPGGGIWKVKSATDRGIDFKPSVQIGFGRHADEPRFLAAWNAMSGFIVADVTEFPIVRVDRIPIDNIIRWNEDDMLGANAKVPHHRYRAELRPDIVYD